MILWQRKTYRLVMGSIFPLTYYFSSKVSALIITGICLSLMILFEIERMKHPGLYKWVLAHLGGIFKLKVGKLTGTTYFLIGIFIIIILFEKNIAIASIFFLILGDAGSAIVGVNYGKIKLFGKKTLEGSLAFLAIDLVAGLFFLLTHLLSINPFVLISGVFISTLVELFPIPIDDNLTVGISCAIAMKITRRFLVC